METSLRLLNKISRFFIFILLIYLPLSELFLHALLSYTSFSEGEIFWLSHFYEPILALILLLYFLHYLLRRKNKLNLTADKFLLAFFLFTVLSLALNFRELSRGLEGLRYLVLPYAGYLVMRFSGSKKAHEYIQLYLIISLILSAMAIVEYFFLPAGYFGQYLGLTNFGFGQHSLISTPQAMAVLAGPNQLASYLIFPFLYLVHLILTSRRNLLFQINTYFLLAMALAIGLTYSRSAIIGLFIGLIIMIIVEGHHQRTKVANLILLFTTMVSLAVSYAFYNGELPRDIITHGASLASHWGAATSSLKAFFAGGLMKIVFGFGVGSAGPLALKLGGIISEDYYLQVAFEVGILGLFSYLAFIFFILKLLWQYSRTTFYALLALLINGLFLHVFADNPAMAVSVFVVIGAIANLDAQNRAGEVDINRNRPEL